MQSDERLIRDPEEELAATYRIRVRPFIDLDNAAMTKHYQQAWEIARAWLVKVRERSESHAS